MSKVKPHYRTSSKGRRFKVRGYTQKRKSSRGKKTKTQQEQKRNSNTFWLKNQEGHFTGRANKNGTTTSSTHTSKRLDRTGINRERRKGRIYGRF